SSPGNSPDSTGIDSGIIAASGASISSTAGRLEGGAMAAAPRLADWDKLPADELPADGAAVLAGIVGGAVLPALAAESEFFRRSPRATRSVPLACSTLIGFVSTRLAPMR